jgi:hypothetical protein
MNKQLFHGSSARYEIICDQALSRNHAFWEIYNLYIAQGISFLRKVLRLPSTHFGAGKYIQTYTPIYYTPYIPTNLRFRKLKMQLWDSMC